MRWVLAVLAALATLGILGTFNFLRPADAVPATQLVPAVQRVAGDPPALPWPAGAAAVGVTGMGVIGTHGDNSPQPLASVAKVMTTLVVVRDHPLTPVQEGDAITVTADDVANYLRQKAAGQSVVPVESGEILNLRQLLEGTLIPSGNNFADILARWDAGSIDAFVGRMNSRAAELGMKKTHFVDVTGLSEHTVGTPSDMIKAGEALMAIPVLAQIVGEGQVSLPVAGVVFNVNYALGRSGIVGIKTGSAPKAGANLLFAAGAKIYGRSLLIIGMVMGEPTLDDAFQSSQRLIAAVTVGLVVTAAVSRADPVAEFRSPWGSRTRLVAQTDLGLVAWPGLLIHRRVSAPAVQPPVSEGEPAGSLMAWIGTGAPQSVALATDGPLFEPGGFWRLTRPFTDYR